MAEIVFVRGGALWCAHCQIEQPFTLFEVAQHIYRTRRLETPCPKCGQQMLLGLDTGPQVARINHRRRARLARAG